MQPCRDAQTALINWNRNSTGNPEQDRFIPRIALIRKLFNRPRVRRILRCHEGDCHDCGGDYKFLCSGRGTRMEPAGEVERILPKAYQLEDLTATAITLFALFVRIGHPLLIIPLLEAGRNDSNASDSYCEGSFEFPKIRERYWNECRHGTESNDDYSIKVAVLIQQNLSDFVRPIFRDENFHRVHQNLRLPIYNEKLIGEGSFGKVFAFQIFEGYNRLPTFKNVQKFARKVISRGLETGALPGHEEGRKLSIVNALGNPHIVQIVTSFTYRDEFNIVFRQATTNLEKALREPQHQLSQIVPPLQSCQLWPQMLGLAKALKAFSSGNWNRSTEPDDSNSSTEEAENSRVSRNDSVAIHFDLKPSNILVDRSSPNPLKFDLIISDFGLAHIKDTTSGSSDTRDRGGDEAYAPPECMLDKQSRKYDIWSLGCIFLEVLTFLVMSYDGVRALDAARRRPSAHGARQNLRFWEEVPRAGPSLKESVEEFVSQLGEQADIRGGYSRKEQRLIANTITMIRKMLCIEPRHRLTSKEVVWWLERIGCGYEMRDVQGSSVGPDLADTVFNQRPDVEEQTTHQRSVSQQWWESAKKDVQLAERRNAEFELEPRSLKGLRGLFIRSNTDPNEEPSRAILQVFAEEKGHLRFVVTSLNLVGQQPLEQNCPGQYVHLMPQYAFRKDHTRSNDAGIRLVWSDDLHKSVMRYDLSGELNDLRKIHGALLGQEIYHTIQVQDVALVQPYTSRWRASKLNGINDEEGPFTVQLWRENASRISSEIRRKARNCRIVVYFSTKVYIIPFHQLLRLPPEAEISEESLTVLESRTVGDTKQTFELTVLQASEPPHILPTFPLDAARLEDSLTNQPVAFKAFTISFRAHDHLHSFWRDYRVLKEHWLQETGVKPKLFANTPPTLTLNFT